MNRLSTIILLLLATLFFTTTVFATTIKDMKIVQSFCRDGVIYAFIDTAGWKGEQMWAQAQIGAEPVFRQTNPIMSTVEEGTPINYMFLIDVSTSMAPVAVQKNVSTFMEEFIKNAGDNSKFMLATFGEEFSVVGEFTSDSDKIMEDLNGIKYNEQQTSLYAGILNAMDLCDKIDSVRGELYNIIIISDGIEVDKKGPTFGEVESRIKEYSVMLHTFGIQNTGRGTTAEKTESENALKDLGVYANASYGRHTVLGYGDVTPVDAATEITNYVSGLYALEFNISSFRSSGGEYPVTLYFYSDRDLVGILPSVNIKISAAAKPALPPPQNSPDPTPAEEGQNKNPETPQESEANNNPEESDNQEPEENSEAPGEQAPSSENPADNVTDENAEEESNTNKNPLDIKLFATIGAAVGVLLLAGIAAKMLSDRKRNTTSRSATGGSRIFMRLEVINGQYAGKSDEYYLQNELIIGKDKKCDIVFKDKDISSKNSRVFIQDNIIYIEDLNSKSGTAISGMKIHAQNRLRSGDVITIGTVSFVLKF